MRKGCCKGDIKKKKTIRFNPVFLGGGQSEFVDQPIRTVRALVISRLDYVDGN